MTIRSMPTTPAYREGWERVYKGKRPQVDPAETHEVVKQIISKLLQKETCGPCNEEHPKGESCPKCGRTLLLG